MQTLESFNNGYKIDKHAQIFIALCIPPRIVKKYGGKLLTGGEKVTTIEGEEYAARMVILEFPSEDHVRAWFADPDYVKAKVWRQAASRARILVQRGGLNTEDPDPKL